MRLWRESSAEERIAIYRGAMTLHATGENAYQIWKRVSLLNHVKLHRNTVYFWTVGKRDSSKKYLGRVISSPSPQLSYVVMAAKGDGCSGMRRNGVKGYLYVMDFRVRGKGFRRRIRGMPLMRFIDHPHTRSMSAMVDFVLYPL
jgi:hypothetical protein